MNRTWLASALLALALTNAAGAQDTNSGNYYYEGCKSYLQSSRGPLFMQGACFATVKTLMDFPRILSRKARFCAPKEATIEHSRRRGLPRQEPG
jgi:hypothetical protein